MADMDGFNTGKSIQDTKYNKNSFRAYNPREKLESSYFAFTGDDCYKIFPFLEKMKSNHRKCRYWALLKYYCPCSSEGPTTIVREQTKPGRRHKTSHNDLLNDHCTVRSVHAFVCAVLKRLIPSEFFGNQQNQNCFFKRLLLLFSVQRYGEVSLYYLTRGIALSKMSWLQHLQTKKQKEMFLEAANFLIMKTICPLIQSFFYTVQSSHRKIKLFFFRKKIWCKLSHAAFAEFSKFSLLRFMQRDAIQELLEAGMCLGCSKLSFILKKSSLRPLCNYSFTERGKASINDHLRNLLVVLKYIMAQKPSKFGIVGKGKSDFQRKLKEFLLKMKEGNVQQLYFVTADVEKCFDSINPTHLFDIVSNLITSDIYVVHRYKKTVLGKKEHWYVESVEQLAQVQAPHGTKAEHVSKFTVRRTQLLTTLKALLTYNVVKFGSYYYWQKKGVAQGSSVSSILCAVYLSKIEEDICIPMGCYDFCIRMEDEYLLLSPEKSIAEEFLPSLSYGMKAHNININLKKCSTNFDCYFESWGFIAKSTHAKLYGLSIDPSHLSVTSDYSSYQGLDAADMVTWKLCKNPGNYLKKTVIRSLGHKSDYLLFDVAINSYTVIEKNLLPIFCMTAVKFHFLVMHLPSENRIDNNLSFFTNLIFKLPSSLKQIIIKALRKSSGSKQNHAFPVSEEELKSLCCNVFIFKMKQHKPLYEKLIPKITTVANINQMNCSDQYLKDSIKEAFQKIFIR